VKIPVWGLLEIMDFRNPGESHVLHGFFFSFFFISNFALIFEKCTKTHIKRAGDSFVSDSMICMVCGAEAYFLKNMGLVGAAFCENHYPNGEIVPVISC
jgi:hypothetical protein